MTREKAFKVAGKVADAGLSVDISIGVHPGLDPREHCSVHSRPLNYTADNLRTLVEIADGHGLTLVLLGGDLRFLEASRA